MLSMAEKQDIPMNQFPIWSSMDYVYVERGNSQGKVHKSNFLSALVLGNKNEPYDCNEIKSGCIIGSWRNLFSRNTHGTSGYRSIYCYGR